ARQPTPSSAPPPFRPRRYPSLRSARYLTSRISPCCDAGSTWRINATKGEDMHLQLDADQNTGRRVDLSRVETYVDFRTQLPKPTREDAHLRHILRFYTARSFAKSGYDDVYVLPDVTLNGPNLDVAVMAVRSEERRVGKECGRRGSRDTCKT